MGAGEAGLEAWQQGESEGADGSVAGEERWEVSGIHASVYGEPKGCGWERPINKMINDTLRLEWLIANGYTPAKWRKRREGDAEMVANGMVRVGRGTRREIDRAMAGQLRIKKKG